LLIFKFNNIVNIDGNLLIPCGLRVEARVGDRENEIYEVLEIEGWSTEVRAVVLWPTIYENEKDKDWFIRVLYGENKEQVKIFFFIHLLIFYLFIYYYIR
jgi:hypothetical protein